MEKQYSIIRKDYWGGVNSYLEVHIRNVEDMLDLQEKINKISSVKGASPKNGYFVVYVRKPYTIDELESEINSFLKRYYEKAYSYDLETISNAMESFDKAKMFFDKASRQCNSTDNTRECLDNFRLSLELMLKEILKNDKSLENQRIPLMRYLEQKGVSSEINTLFWHVLDCYSKYQNNRVKHNFDVTENDIPIIIEQTKSMINILTRLERE